MPTSLSDADKDTLIEIADAMAEAARAAIMPHFRKAVAADNKDTTGAFDPVTVADRAAEEAMRGILSDRRPKDAILGEEFGSQTGETGLTWVLDPIDGTRGFISGTPTWGVLIAICDDSGPIYGVIDQPYIGERFRGGFGRATLNGPHGDLALRTCPPRSLDQATLCSTFPEIGTPADRAAFAKVDAAARLTRYGMDCYGYALLALGQIDLVIEAGLAAYDICAPIAVVEAAGGVVTDWCGGPVHAGGRALAAANPQIHAEALALLNAP